jgi:hypothetical protein
VIPNRKSPSSRRWRLLDNISGKSPKKCEDSAILDYDISVKKGRT